MSTASIGRHGRHPAEPRRRFGLFPVRRRASAIADAIKAGPPEVSYDNSYDHNGWDAGTPAQDPESTMLLRPAADPAPGPAPFTGASMEPLPAPLAVPVMTEPELATLARVADRLRAWQPPGGPAQDEPGPGQDGPDGDDLPPGACLRAVPQDGSGPGRVLESLAGFPFVAGLRTAAGGHRMAGVCLGDAEGDIWPVWESASAECFDEAIAAFRQARDLLVYGELRPVPAAAEGGAL